MSDKPENGALQPWRTLSTEKVLDSGIFTVERVGRENPSTGKKGEFHLIRSNDWVNVLAVTPDDEVVLIRQYRHGVDEIQLEIPGGILDDGESPTDAGRRELLEETGYECDEVTIIGRTRPNPALFDNWQYTVLAMGARPTGSTSFDEHEEIEPELYPIDRIDDMIRSGEITHALVLNAFHWYRLYRESIDHNKA